MTCPLAGLRILDLSRGPAAGIATMILADFGADVLVVERPGEDPFTRLPSAPMWRRGKHRITLDLDTASDRETFELLCRGADVLVCNWRGAALAKRELDYQAVSQRHPQLIYCHVTGFGNRGPYAQIPGYEHTVAAMVGRMNGFAGIVDRDGPVLSALQVSTHACAQFAVSGILAALLAKGENGAGRLVETSLLQGMLPYEQGPLIARQLVHLLGEIYAARGAPEPPMPSLYYHPAQAGDGKWMQFGNLLPHLFDNFLMVTGLIDVIADPDWNAAQMVLPPEKHEQFRDRMLKRIQERPAADWMADFIDNGGVVATSYQTSQQALEDPDIVANGHVIQRKEGGVQLGPVARLTKTPAEPGPPIADGTKMAQRWLSEPRTPPAGEQTGLPLAGIRIVEIATIIAAPLGASFLTDMGAEVIKVEQVGGDPYRGLAMGVGAARVNAGKRSISLDLKSEAGQKIVQQLIADADVLIHNYRPGVPERLGFGYDQVTEFNADIVYLQSNGYGPDGPSAMRPSTHPIPGAAMGGVMYQMGDRVPGQLQDVEGLRLWTRRLMRANEVNPDPNTAMVVLTSAMLGLVARQRTGQGQRILMDMFGANAWANHDDFLDYPGKAPRAKLDEAGYGLSPTWRLYPCAGDSWVFLGLMHDHEKPRFTRILKDAGVECPELETLSSNDIEKALSAMFLTASADDWQSRLASEGIGCVRADARMPAEFWLDDAHAQELELTQPIRHSAWGEYRRHGAGVTFDGRQPTLGPPPLAGEHGEAILAELGYSADEIGTLFASGAVWREQMGG